MITLMKKIEKKKRILLKISNLRFKRCKSEFKSVTEEWLKYVKNNVKKSTYYNYTYSVERYLYPEFEGKDITKIRNINDFVTRLSGSLASKTVRDIIAKLKEIIKYYEEENNVKLNIKKISLPKIKRKEIQILNKKEKESLEDYCKSQNTLQALGIMICLNTGLRIGEVCALKWEDINLNERKIYVRKTIERVYIKRKRKSKIIIDTPKSRSSVREIPINKKLYSWLKREKGKCNDDCFILTGSEKRYLEPRNYQYNFKAILKKNNLRKLKFHTLRHTFATNCIEAGMDIKSLSEILGHADVSVTLNIYVHSSDKIKRKYLDKI